MKAPFKIGDKITVFPTRDELHLSRVDGVEERIKVEPRVMKVLILLSENEGSVVHREQFVENIWDNYESADEALTQAISILRKTIGDQDRNQRIIETIPKKGYKLNFEIVPLAEGDITEDDELENSSKSSMSKPLRRIIIFLITLVVILSVWLLIDQVFEEESIAPQAPKSEEVRSQD